MVAVSAALEADMAGLPEEDKQHLLEGGCLEEPGLDRLAHAAYRLLGLLTYFTVGPKEVRAWTIHAGETAPQAAGAIHSDFEKGFIRAEVIAYDDYVATAARPAPGRPGGCASRAATTSSGTATSCTSASTSDRAGVKRPGLPGRILALDRRGPGA